MQHRLHLPSQVGPRQPVRAAPLGVRPAPGVRPPRHVRPPTFGVRHPRTVRLPGRPADARDCEALRGEHERSGDGAMHVHIIGPTKVATPHGVLGAGQFGGVKPRQILEILALSAGTPGAQGDGWPHLLWDGHPPRSYLATLESYVCVLRRSLAGRRPGGGRGGRRSTRATCSTRTSTPWTSDAFRRLARDARARGRDPATALATLERALDLVGGDAAGRRALRRVGGGGTSPLPVRGRRRGEPGRLAGAGPGQAGGGLPPRRDGVRPRPARRGRLADPDAGALRRRSPVRGAAGLLRRAGPPRRRAGDRPLEGDHGGLPGGPARRRPRPPRRPSLRPARRDPAPRAAAAAARVLGPRGRTCRARTGR